MVNKFIAFFGKDFSGLHEAAFVLGVSAGLSHVLALIRDRLFASTFGAGEILDIYYASFRIPDLIYVLIASLVATAILIPLVVEKGAHEKKEDLRNFLNSILTFFILVLLVVSAFAYMIIPLVADTFVPGFSSELQNEFILLSRILLLSPLFLGLSNLFGSITQSLRRFLVYALTPIMYNVGIIFGVLFLYEPYGIAGLAYGVVIGALLHFAIQVPFVMSRHLMPRLVFNIDFNAIKEVVLLSLPRTISLSITHIVIIIFTAIASVLTVGSITIFNFAYNLQSVPLAVIGVSYSVAAFPTLSRLFLNGEEKEFVQYVTTAIKHIIFWSLPVLSLFVILRAQIVRSILGAGAFDWTDTRLTAAALALFSFSVAAQGLILLFVRAYYASGNTKRPLYINLIAGSSTLLFAYILLGIFDASETFRVFFEDLFRVSNSPGTKVLMLPFAFSLGAIMNLIILWVSFKHDFKESYVSIRRSLFKSLAGAIVVGGVAYILLQFLDEEVYDVNTFIGIFAQGFFAGLGAITAGALFFELIKHKEFIDFRISITKRIFKTKPVLPGPEEL